MRLLRTVLLSLALVTWVLNVSAATASAAVPADTCTITVIRQNCPGADPDWFWICTWSGGGYQIHNECDIFLKSE